MKIKQVSYPLRTTLIYAVFGALWIFLSDTVLTTIIPHTPPVYPLAQTIKGWFYILVSALLLYLVLSRDAKHLQKRDEELRESHNLYRELFENSPQPMWVYDLETLQFLMVNDAAMKQYGYTREQFLGMTIKDIRPVEEIPALLENLAHPPQKLEQSTGWLHRKKDGTLINVEISSHSTEFEGRAARLVLANDVTERIQAEKTTRRNEAQYRALFEQSNDAVFILDLQGNHIQVNHRAAEMLGYTVDEIQNLSFRETSAETEESFEVLKRLAAGERVPTYERLFRKKNGEVFPVDINVDLVQDEEGRPLHIQSVVRDITGRKQVEKILQASEERLKEAQRMAHIGSWELDLTGNVLTWSDEIYRIFEIDPAQFRASYQAFLDLVHPDDRSRVNQAYTDSLKDHTPYDIVHRLLMPDGRIKYVQERCESLYSSDGTPLRSLGAVQDITERKLAEEAFHTSELRFRALIEHGQDNISLVDANGILLWENPSATHMLGYVHNEFKGRNIFDLVHPDDLKQVQAQFAEVLAEPDSVKHASFRLKHADRTWRWVEGIGTNLLHEQSVGAVVINYRDVTERKQAEEAQRQSEILFFKIFRSSPIGINIFHLSDGRGYTVNDAFLEIVGYSREEIIGHSAMELELFVDTEMRDAWMQSLNEGRRIINQDAKIRRKSGEIRDCLISLDIMELNGEPMVLAIASDITERKQVEDLLKQSEERYRNTLDTMLEGIQILDFEWRYVYLNEAAAEQGQNATEDLLGYTMMEAYPGIEYTELFATLRDCMNNRTTKQFENEFFFPNGMSGWFELNVQPAPEGIFILSIDITERKKAEEQLRRSEQRFRLMAENIEEGFWITDPANNKEVYLSPAVEAIFGRSLQELMGDPSSFLDHVLPEDRPQVMTNMEKQKHGESTSMEYRIQRSDGSVRWIWDRAFPVLKDDGTVNIITGILTDITERKEAEVRIQTQLKRLSALSAIDSAINTSMDMRLTLDVFLRETIAQLNVDAADILLYNPTLQSLSYAQGYGFRSKGWEEGYLQLGEGLAGRTVMTRQRVHIPDLNKIEDDFIRQPLLVNEGFIVYFGVPLIAKGQIKGVLEVFHRSLLDPDSEWLDYLMTLAGQAGIAIDNAQLFQGLQRSNQELSMAYDATIAGWSHAMDLRDKETEGHTQRVTDLTVRLAERMGIDPQELIHIRRGALLHDIGKLGVPDHILLKPGKLTEEEWDTMRKHPTYARDMLMPINYLRPALDIPYCHHEKWDGSGYPRGLKGEEIPLSARLFAVVDVWDALRSDRPYRDGWSAQKTRDYIQAESGKHFEPQVVETFMQMLKEDPTLQA